MEDVEIIVILIFISLILSFLVASFAEKKGRSGIGYFLLSCVISPLFTLIILLIVGDSDEKRLTKIKEEEEVRLETRETSVEKSSPIPTSIKLENLEKLGSLLEKGIITKNEFEKEKKIILSENVSNVVKIKKPEKAEKPKKVEISPDMKTTFEEINKEINKAKSNFWGNFNYDLPVILEKKCFDKKQTLELLDKYESYYGIDLIEKIANISLRVDKTKEYLNPFIEQGIAEPVHPHKRIVSE